MNPKPVWVEGAIVYVNGQQIPGNKVIKFSYPPCVRTELTEKCGNEVTIYYRGRIIIDLREMPKMGLKP